MGRGIIVFTPLRTSSIFPTSRDVASLPMRSTRHQGAKRLADRADPARGVYGKNSCSQIQITPSGKFLYAPNRGHNSIACFAVDATTGHLTPRGHQPTETIPRAFSLDPTGTFLYAAGLESGRLAGYRIDETTGLLQPLEVYPVGTRPMWVIDPAARIGTARW